MSDLKIRILVVEDEPIVAEDIADCLESVGFDVTAIAYSGEEAMEFLSNQTFEAALLDITLGGEIDGIMVANEINKNHQFPFVFLTSHSDRGTLEKVKSTFPSGYLVKPYNEPDLLTSLEIAVSNFVMRNAKKEFSIELVNEQIPTPLSLREFEILNLMKEGKTNKEIAEEIHLSVNTVKTHLLHVYEKLDAKNRTETMFKINELLKS